MSDSTPDVGYPALRPGADVGGRYRLERLVASGGMAQVWRATDEVLQRPVAVKVLHPHLAADETFGARFRREAVAAARLAHPNIVATYDTVRDGDIDAIVMELVEGETLRDRLDRTPVLDPDEAVRIGRQVLDALDEAHRLGMVHRDIKPANVLLLPDGRVKVADFGIAKLDDTGDLTSDGMMVGTAKYLAPEQVRSEPVDARTDLYATGVVLYEMLTGRPPFSGATAAATALARLTSDPPRPRQVMATVPPAIDEIVVRSMARDPDRRYQHAADMRAALLTLDVDPDATIVEHLDDYDDDTSFVARERSWLLPTVVVLIVAFSLGLAGVLFGRTEAGKTLFNKVTGTPKSEKTTPATLVDAVDFDPAGRGGEHSAEAANAIDRNAATVWTTETYNDPNLVPLKGGVGLYVTLDHAADIARLTVVTPSQHWTAQIYVAGSPAPDLAGWGQPVKTVTDVSSTQQIDLDDHNGRAVLLWLTNVGQGGKFELSELRVATA